MVAFTLRIGVDASPRRRKAPQDKEPAVIDSPAVSARYAPVTLSNVARAPEWSSLDADLREAVEVVARVLPFRTNRYVMEELIDWSRVPDDPIFQLTFPQRGMLEDAHYEEVRRLVLEGGDPAALKAAVARIRRELNPHPAGQQTDNVPHIDGEPLPGAQHKYPQTLLFFPSQGQTCHAYCTFCFRWAQFVGEDDLRFRSNDAELLTRYLAEHEEISDLLFTGGDPMVMKSEIFRRYVDAIISDPRLEHIQTIRIGTKSLAYWPQRYVTDPDADDLLRTFEEIVSSGRTLSIMGHYSHGVEFSTPVAREAVRRVRSTGANIRMQSPVIRRVNDDPEVWQSMWREGVRLGCIPYYMFVERDTGARRYFELPLVRCWEIFREAYAGVSGIARTVRGPSMSAWPGKVHIVGVRDVGDEPAFILQYLQCRRPELVRQPFFAKFDPKATWFDQLEPLTEADAEMFPQRWEGSRNFVPLTIDED
jgi:L-lysine 2,3-aminomutase